MNTSVVQELDDGNAAYKCLDSPFNPKVTEWLSSLVIWHLKAGFDVHIVPELSRKETDQ